MSAWPGIVARLEAGEAVTVDEIAKAVATEPPPAEARSLAVRNDPPARKRGRPTKWTAADKVVIRNLCERARLWSELENPRRPMRKEDIYRNVGRILRHPMEGKSVQNLIADAPSTGLRPVRADEVRAVLHPRFGGDPPPP